MKLYCYRPLLLLFFICFSPFVHAGNTTDSTSRSKKNTRLELSFGNTQFFISDSATSKIRSSNDVIIATHAMLFFIEFRPTKKFRLPIFFNLPTESKQYLVNGILKNERASPTLGFGVQYNCFHINMNERSAFELDLGPNASFVLRTSGQVLFAPILAGRIRFLRDKNLVMYIGSSYSIGINAFGLFYGTGFFF